MSKYKIEDSGVREELGTGAVRDTQENKGRFDLITPHGMVRLAQHYEAGAKKYADRNWEKGIPVSRCFSSAVRHLFQWLAGESTEDHLAAAAWNIFAIMHFETKNKAMLDIPSREEATCSDVQAATKCKNQECNPLKQCCKKDQ